MSRHKEKQHPLTARLLVKSVQFESTMRPEQYVLDKDTDATLIQDFYYNKETSAQFQRFLIVDACSEPMLLPTERKYTATQLSSRVGEFHDSVQDDLKDVIQLLDVFRDKITMARNKVTKDD